MTESEWLRRFWEGVRVNETTGCWDWTKARHPRGYGHVRLLSGKWAYSHRVAYELLADPIPDGLVLDHLCRNTSCVNPQHLEPVTQRKNLRRAPDSVASLNGNKTHCIRGHEFTPANTYRLKGGYRRCRACHLARAKTAAAMRPAA